MKMKNRSKLTTEQRNPRSRGIDRLSSLEIVDLAGYYGDPDNWVAGSEYGGSPGAFGQGPNSDVVINEVLSSLVGFQVGTIELHNTAGHDIDLGGWYLSNSSDDYSKFRIPDGTIIPAGGFRVFDERDFCPSGAANFAAGGVDVNLNEFLLDAGGGSIQHGRARQILRSLARRR